MYLDSRCRAAARHCISAMDAIFLLPRKGTGKGYASKTSWPHATMDENSKGRQALVPPLALESVDDRHKHIHASLIRLLYPR